MGRYFDSRLLTVEQAAKGIIIHFHQPNWYLQEAKVDCLRHALRDLFDRLEPGLLILDLSNVEYVTAEVLGLFVTLHRQATARGARLLLCNVCDFVYETLAVTHLTRIFDVHRRCEQDDPVHNP